MIHVTLSSFFSRKQILGIFYHILLCKVKLVGLNSLYIIYWQWHYWAYSRNHMASQLVAGRSKLINPLQYRIYPGIILRPGFGRLWDTRDSCCVIFFSLRKTNPTRNILPYIISYLTGFISWKKNWIGIQFFSRNWKNRKKNQEYFNIFY